MVLLGLEWNCRIIGTPPWTWPRDEPFHVQRYDTNDNWPAAASRPRCKTHTFAFCGASEDIQTAERNQNTLTYVSVPMKCGVPPSKVFDTSGLGPGSPKKAQRMPWDAFT